MCQTGTQNIKHALGSQKLSSDNEYVREFKSSIYGKPPSNLGESYPEHDFARKVTKMTSKVKFLIY